MKSLALIALFLATQAHAAGDWLLVAESDIAKSYVKVGSIELGLNDSNEPIVFGTFRLVTKQRRVLLGREYVKLADCRRGYGKLVSTTLDAKLSPLYIAILVGTIVLSTLAIWLILAMIRTITKLENNRSE